MISKSYWTPCLPMVQAALRKAASEACAFGQELVDRMDADGLKYSEQNRMTIHPFPGGNPRRLP